MAKGLDRFRNDEYSTLSILLKRFNYEKVIKLEEICDKYFGINYGTAKKRASKHALPIAAFRLGESQKQPLMVDIDDLANHIDSVSAQANREWNKFQ
jgi:hypothetical protein